MEKEISVFTALSLCFDSFAYCNLVARALKIRAVFWQLCITRQEKSRTTALQTSALGLPTRRGSCRKQWGCLQVLSCTL